MKKLGGVFLAAVFLFACQGGGGAAPADEQDVKAATNCVKVGTRCLKDGTKTLPSTQSTTFAFPTDKCFHWNRGGDSARVDSVKTTKKNRNAGERASARVLAAAKEFDSVFRLIEEHQNEVKDELELAQLRATGIYFDRDPQVPLATATADELFEELEDPIISHWEMVATGFKFTQVNIALGDNPLDIVFAEGTLEPLAVAEDDSNTFCAEPLKGK